MSQWTERFRRPGSWSRKRTGAGIAAVVAAALGAGGLVMLTDDAPDKHTPPAAASRVDENEAQRRARDTGKPVTVETTLSPTGTTVANPDGTFTRTERTLPIRVRTGDGWVDVDTTLQRTKAGYAPKATTTKLLFAAGGSSGLDTHKPVAHPGRRAPMAPPTDAVTPPSSPDPGAPGAEGPGSDPVTVPPVVESWPTEPIPPGRVDAAWSDTPLPEGALVRMITAEGRSFTVSWANGPLPAAKVTRDRVLYPDVFPGVDLVLTARDQGFSQVLVVKTPEAAADPRVAQVAYQLSSLDVSFRHDENGSTVAVDHAGAEAAVAPTPFMWDSAGHAPGSLWDQRQQSFAAAQTPPTKSAQATPSALMSTPAAGPLDEPLTGTLALPGLEGPEPGTHEAIAASVLDNDRLRITPDQKLLTDTATVFPVFVDPSFWGHSQAWTLAYEPYPTATYWMGGNFNGGTTNARVGHENQTGGTARSYFRMAFDPSLQNASITAATFRALEVHAWSCNPRPVNLYLTDPIKESTSWSSRPAEAELQESVNVAKGYSANCPGDWVPFNVMNAVTKAKNQGWPNITLGLRAANESDTYAWKKFDVNPSLEITYKRPPNPPTDISTTPGGACNTTSPGTMLGQTDVTINARATDPDGDLARIWLTVGPNSSSSNIFSNYLAVDGQGWIHYRIPMAQLQNDVIYSFFVQSNDATGLDSDASAIVKCYFKVDTSAPNPPGVSSPQFKAGSDTAWPEGPDYGTAGDFTFTAGGSADTVTYAYSFDNTWYDNRVTVPAGGSATIKATPKHSGPNQLYVKAMDAGGNLSSPTTYAFFVEPRDQVDGAMDFTGDQRPDLAVVNGAGDLQVYPSTDGGRLALPISATKDDDGSGNPAQPQVPTGYFQGTLTTYNGDWWGGDGFQDLIARMPDGKLWVYPGNGRGGIDTTGRMEILLPVGSPDPKDFTQILALGDATGDKLPDMLAVVGTDLWAFNGYTGASMLSAAKIGTGGFDNYTIHGAGDITGDTAYDLLLREKTGTGKLLLRAGAKNPNGVGTDLASLGGTSRTEYGAGGWMQAAYPIVVAIPDVTGDGIPDLWAQTSNGFKFLYPGGRTVHGTRADLNGDAWNYCLGFAGAGGGTQTLCGPILDKYIALGGPQWALPSSSTLTSPTKPGKFTQFRLPGSSTDDASIFWSAETGTHEIHGSIRAKWASLSSENSYLGFPSSDTYDVSNGQRTDFPGGYIRWNRANNVSNDYTYGGETPTGRITVGGDFNGDGKADIATMVDYVNCAAGLWTHLGKADGGFDAPVESWKNNPGGWCALSAKYTAGDFNGDGRDDIAALYNYGGGHVKLQTFLADPNGKFPATQLMSWEQMSGFDWARTTLLAGDTNGDGRDEAIAVYGYSDGRITHYTFPSRTDGGFNAPVKGYDETHPGWWWYESARYTAGDFNGDGRTDIAAVYMYDNGDAATLTSLANPDGTIGTPVLSWKAVGVGWNRTSVQLVAGDVNGDHRADIAMMYAHPSDRMALYTFTSKTDGGFNAPVISTDTGTGKWNASNSQALMGDVNADGRADIYTIYDYRTTRWAAFTFQGQPTGGFDSGTMSWSAPWGIW